MQLVPLTRGAEEHLRRKQKSTGKLIYIVPFSIVSKATDFAPRKKKNNNKCN